MIVKCTLISPQDQIRPTCPLASDEEEEELEQLQPKGVDFFDLSAFPVPKSRLQRSKSTPLTHVGAVHPPVDLTNSGTPGWFVDLISILILQS